LQKTYVSIKQQSKEINNLLREKEKYEQDVVEQMQEKEQTIANMEE